MKRSPISLRVGRLEDDDGVAMLMSLMVIMVAAVLSITAASAVLVQVKPTQINRKLIRALNAAEAGIHVAQRQIRVAEATRLLPCGPFVGELGGPGRPRYEATVRYYSQDPTGKPEGWLEDSRQWLSACPLVSVPALTPWWAVVTSTGSGESVPGASTGAGNRTLTAIIKPLAVVAATTASVTSLLPLATASPTPTPVPTQPSLQTPPDGKLLTAAGTCRTSAAPPSALTTGGGGAGGAGADGGGGAGGSSGGSAGAHIGMVGCGGSSLHYSTNSSARPGCVAVDFGHSGGEETPSFQVDAPAVAPMRGSPGVSGSRTVAAAPATAVAATCIVDHLSTDAVTQFAEVKNEMLPNTDRA